MFLIELTKAFYKLSLKLEQLCDLIVFLTILIDTFLPLSAKKLCVLCGKMEPEKNAVNFRS